MKMFSIISMLMLCVTTSVFGDITPYKYTDEECRTGLPMWVKILKIFPKWFLSAFGLALQSFPETREEYDQIMDQIVENPLSQDEFLGMTYKYHADAMAFSAVDYGKLRTPFLIVTGALDLIINSSDIFVEQAIKAGADVTYLRVSDMDHYVRKRPDIIQQSFDWLKKQLH